MKLHLYLSENLLCLVNSEEKSRGLEEETVSCFFLFGEKRKGYNNKGDDEAWRRITWIIQNR